MFKSPIDRFEGLTDEEIEKKMEDFADLNFTREEEKAMIKAALETFMPSVILLCALFGLAGYIVYKIMT